MYARYEDFFIFSEKVLLLESLLHMGASFKIMCDMLILRTIKWSTLHDVILSENFCFQRIKIIVN